MAGISREERERRKKAEMVSTIKPKVEPRKKRKPIGVPTSKLAVAVRDGYHRHWINDVGGRLAQAEEGGYEFVLKKDVVVSGEAQQGQGTRISQIVGTKETGEPLYAFLMEIRQDWYDEDQREKQRPVDETENAIREGSLGNGGLQEHEKYVANGGIKLR